MKNLPDDELFNSVENRLRNYSELPDDDVWDSISGAVTSSAPKWTIWTNRTAATLSLVILCLLFIGEIGSTPEVSKISSNGVPAAEKEAGRASIITSPAQDPRQDKNVDRNGRNSKHANVASSESSMPNSFNSVNANQTALAYDEEGSSAAAIPTDRAVREGVARSTGESAGSDSVVVTEMKEVKQDSSAEVGHVVPPKRRKKSKLSFYSMISPSLSFQHFTPDSEDGIVVDKINSPGVISHERFGFSVESGIQGQIGKRFQYVLGLSYYQQSQQLQYEVNADGSIIESSDDLNFEIKPMTSAHEFDYSMRNIGVQAGILYTLKQTGLMHKAGIVLQYQKGLMRAIEGDVYDNSSSDYINYQLVYRVEYSFRSGLGLFVQPSYTHSIVANESLNAPFNLKLSRAGLGLGVVYRF